MPSNQTPCCTAQAMSQRECCCGRLRHLHLGSSPLLGGGVTWASPRPGALRCALRTHTARSLVCPTHFPITNNTAHGPGLRGLGMMRFTVCFLQLPLATSAPPSLMAAGGRQQSTRLATHLCRPSRPGRWSAQSPPPRVRPGSRTTRLRHEHSGAPC